MRGWPGMHQGYLDFAHMENLNFFVVRHDGKAPLQFSASGYVKAYELLQQGSQTEEVQQYENELQFLAVQLGAGQNKIAISDAFMQNRKTMSTGNVRRNAILPTSTPTPPQPRPIADLGSTQTRTCVRVEIETDDAGKLICPNTACDEAFADEKALIWHLRKDIKANSNICVLCPPVANRKPLTNRMLTEHITSHVNNKMIGCEMCGKPVLESKKDQHDLKHHTTKLDAEHWCDPCSKPFTRAGFLDRHNKAAHGGSKMECPKCGRTMTEASYETHRKIACKADESIAERERVSCPYCHQPILKKNIHDHCRKHARNGAIMDFLDALPVLEDEDEGMESDHEMEKDEAADDEDEM